MNKYNLFVLIALLSGCASNNEAVFVTSTSVSILEADSKPAGVNIGYKRIEGYIGPNNADGTAPPVLASIESDGQVFNPKIRQLYATGDAAIIASGGKPKKRTKSASKDAEVMFFGTSTNIGLSVGTTSSIPDSFNFGYKRKELSVIPLVEEGDSFRYPSVLASIDNTAKASTDGVNMETNQFFASGIAAQEMASKLREVFVERSNLKIDDAQRIEAGGAIQCYSGVKLNDLKKVWRHASDLRLFYEKDAQLDDFYKAASADLSQSISFDSAKNSYSITDYKKLQKRHLKYTSTVHLTDSKDQKRLSKLKLHRNFVCSLSKSSRED